MDKLGSTYPLSYSLNFFEKYDKLRKDLQRRN